MNSRPFYLLLLLAGLCLAVEDDAGKCLAKSRTFAFGGIGIAGLTSADEIAFRTVLDSPGAKAEFLRLVKTDNPQAQCYALVGLHLIDRAAFNTEAARFNGSTKEVETAAGCMIAKQPLGGLVASIRAGTYDTRAKRELRR
jgi:hypothetical protein